MCLKFLLFNPVLFIYCDCPLLKYSCNLVWMTAWRLFLREVLMKSVRVKMGEIGMRGTPKHAVACDLFLSKRRPFTYNFCGVDLTMCFVNLLLNPVSLIFFPVTSSLHCHSHPFHYLAPDFLLFSLVSCTLFWAPTWFLLLLPHHMFKRLSISTVLWCMWRAIPEMICHKEEEGNKLCVYKPYV